MAYKSKFEQTTHKLIPKAEYENGTFPYVIESTYHPDFKINDNLYVETKGLFRTADMRKMKNVRDQYPKVVFILCFMDASKKIRKGSKTTYGKWATDNGFQWCEVNGLQSCISKCLKS